MHQTQKILAYIGARGGSKGLPGKNIKLFCGKPLIAWTIAAALESAYVDAVVVSTDSSEIAEIARAHGAIVPFLRPANLATDEASAHDAISHCLDWFDQESSACFDYIMLLHPTCPLRNAQHIDDAIKKYFLSPFSKQKTLVSVFKADSKSAWLMENSGDYVRFILQFDVNNPRRQNNQICYYPNGAIYLSSWRDAKDFFFYGEKTIPYVMKRDESIDIDTLEDFEEAERLFLEKYPDVARCV